MATNYEENSTVNTITARGEFTKKNYRELPQIAYFRVQSRGLTKGKIDNDRTGTKERTVGAWALLVSCKDGKGLRLVGDVAYEHGMVIKAEFKTREDAIAAGKEYVAKWGKTTARGKADEKKVIEALRNMSEAQIMAMIAASKKAA